MAARASSRDERWLFWGLIMSTLQETATFALCVSVSFALRKFSPPRRRGRAPATNQVDIERPAVCLWRSARWRSIPILTRRPLLAGPGCGDKSRTQFDGRRNEWPSL